MKKKLVTLLVLVSIISTTLIGCGAKKNEDKALNTSNEKSSSESTVKEDNSSKEVKDNDKDISDELKTKAKEEGVSVSEMRKMIDELTAMTAEKYGDTAEGYRQKLKADGKTPFDEFAQAANFMGISIKEYYEYEKNAPEKTAEQKETLQGMADAMKQAENILSDGDKEVTADYRELGIYGLDKIVNEQTAENTLVIQYISNASYDEIVAYFKSQLEGTPNAMFFEEPTTKSATIMGTVNGGAMVNVSIYPADDGVKTNVDYTYNGDLTKK